MVKLGNQPMKQWWPVGLPGVSCISWEPSEKENESTKRHTPLKFNMEPENGGLEDGFPCQLDDF